VKKVTGFLMDHGWAIMLMGFVLCFASFLLFILAWRYHNVYFIQTAKIMVVIGIATYVAGRIAVVFHNRRKKQVNYSEDL
jgi:hypothetical protein